MTRRDIGTADVSVGSLIALAFLAGCGSGALPPAANEETIEETVSNVAAEAGSESASRMWVTAQRLERRTCPSTNCGVVGQLFFREAANVIERRGGWARITQPYDAACVNGRSAYVDRGNAACAPANGITDGRFAEWVETRSLSVTRPADPAETAAADERLVAQSDDFAQHRAAFVRAARQLIADGRCTAADFEEQGGWMKSSNHRDAPVYFTYCGGMTIANRVYLDAESGHIF